MIDGSIGFLLQSPAHTYRGYILHASFCLEVSTVTQPTEGGSTVSVLDL